MGWTVEVSAQTKDGVYLKIKNVELANINAANQMLVDSFDLVKPTTFTPPKNRGGKLKTPWAEKTYTKPTKEQIQFAKALKIKDPDKKTRAQLWKEINDKKEKGAK
ncbi:MAG: hypothetical protein HRT99_04140 [Mycoplasmatales bacterium]|nr:hypothetical protein [Mycoplasmatales bacterium]NQZ66371.1 hypothetical protein [Mycoplasmatales bacterium]